MLELLFFVTFFIFISAGSVFAQGQFEKDLISTSAGDLEITLIGHGTLMFSFDGKVIHVDPFSQLADYAQLPKADMILMTHEHFDHLDPEALGQIRTENSIVVLTETCAEQVQGGIVMKNGDVETIGGLKIEAVPAYNIVHKRDNGQAFHPKGQGNGYIITFGESGYISPEIQRTFRR